MKNVFYFIEKAVFILEIFKFLCFFPSSPHSPGSKGQMEVDNLCHELTCISLQMEFFE